MITATICLQSPLSHAPVDHQGGTGVSVPIRRLPIVSLPGAPEVPCVSGNAVRGPLRRVIMRDLLRRAGDLDLDPVSHDRLYAALANGGHLDGSETQVKPDQVRALREALPPLSVFGSALYSWMLPGRMRVGFAWPICAETIEAGLVGGPAAPWAEDLVDEVGLARHADRTLQDPAISGVTSMVVTTEVLSTGSRLSVRVQFDPETTAVERSVAAWGLDRLTHLGGKSAAGFGAIAIQHDGDPGPYSEWLDTNENMLAERLRDLAGSFRSPKKKRSKKKASWLYGEAARSVASWGPTAGSDPSKKTS